MLDLVGNQWLRQFIKVDVMRVPEQELPDVQAIAEFARCNLPPHYRLKDVRCEYGPDTPHIIPKDFEIVIEYENQLDEQLQGSTEAIRRITIGKAL